MTVWIPPMMPTAGAMAIMFEPQRVDQVSSEQGGRLYGVQSGWPRYTMTLDLNNMEDEDASAWRAFRRSLRGLQRGFLATDLWRPLPLAHADGFAMMTKVGGAPFLGAAATWSQAIDAIGDAYLTLTGLPAGLQLSVDDYVGFKWDASGSPAGSHDRRALTQVGVAAAANATGSVTVLVEPPVPTLVPSGAIPHLDTPSCVMKLLSDTKLARRVLDIDTESGGKIVAAQDLRA